MPTKEECQKIIRSLGWKFGVSPKLVATRLLSDNDKQDMVNGDLPLEALECAVQIWMKYGMPDYAHGDTEPMKKNF